MSKPNISIYDRNGDNGGVSIHKTKTAWIVNTWSRVQGDMTGCRYRWVYDERMPQDYDLAGQHNDYMSNADYLVHCAVSYGRCCKRGHVVQ